MEFEFKRHRRDKVTQKRALDALEQAAKAFHYIEFGKRDLAKAEVDLSSSAIRNAFDGSWSSAIAALRARMGKKGIELRARSKSVWSDQEMFEEMRRVWIAVGHRPSKDEWNDSKPQISYNAYRQRFHGWQNACLRFIEHQMESSRAEPPILGTSEPPHSPSNSSTKKLSRQTVTSDRRCPSQELINKVWKRDKFRCRRCGRTPAIDFGVVLEVDHVVPWAKGGRFE